MSSIINSVSDALIGHCYCTAYGFIVILLVVDLRVGVVVSEWGIQWA